MKIVCIDGNIGAGKSTVLEILKEKYPVHFEDITSWKFLDDFYENKTRWAFTLQTSILLAMQRQYNTIVDKGHEFIFFERSPASSLVFAELLKNDGFINTKEYELLYDLYKKVSWNADKTVYLNTPVAVCLQRIQKRQRGCEANINIDYLSKLDELYKAKYNNNTIIIDTLQDPESVVVDIMSELVKEK